MSLKVKLHTAFFLHFAIWGCFLLTFSGYLAAEGLGKHIGTFYSLTGVVSLIFPLLFGMLADKYLKPRYLLQILVLGAGLFFTAFGLYCKDFIAEGNIPLMLSLFLPILMFFIPSIPLLNSIAFKLLTDNGYDTSISFPYIRVSGTVGFIAGMILTDALNFGISYKQMLLSACIALIQTLFCFLLPTGRTETESAAAGDTPHIPMLKTINDLKLMPFLCVTMLSGCFLLVTEAYTVPSIDHWNVLPEFSGTFSARHPSFLISLSRIAEVCCFFILPFCLKKFSIKSVIAISFIAYIIYFLTMAFGNTGDKLFLFIIGMLSYGIAFNFFYVTAAIWLDKQLGPNMKSTAQGLLSMAYNGIGSFLCLIPGLAFSRFAYGTHPDWTIPWGIMAGIGIAATILLKFIKIK